MVKRQRDRKHMPIPMNLLKMNGLFALSNILMDKKVKLQQFKIFGHKMSFKKINISFLKEK